MSLSGLSDELAQVRTRKKEFLEQIERIVPWGRWIAMVKPCYYKGERGHKPYDLELMARLYLLQNLYNLSDEATVAEVIDSRAFSDFCDIESSNQVPDGDTLGRFRNILVHNGLQEQLFAQVIKLLREKGLLLKKGTIVDSTIIAAPSSTKNQDKQRDPDAHQVKKGNEWHFGYKAHIGVDKDSGLIHTLKVTAANVHDVTMTSKLLTGEETVVYGDSGYLGAEKREDAIITNDKVRYFALYSRCLHFFKDIPTTMPSSIPRLIPVARSHTPVVPNTTPRHIPRLIPSDMRFSCAFFSSLSSLSGFCFFVFAWFTANTAMARPMTTHGNAAFKNSNMVALLQCKYTCAVAVMATANAMRKVVCVTIPSVQRL